MEGKAQVRRTGLNPGMALRLGDRYLYPLRAADSPRGPAESWRKCLHVLRL